MSGHPSVPVLQEQLSPVCSLLAVSLVMSDGRGERQIVELAAASVASLTSCRPLASYLTTDGEGLRAADGSTLSWPGLEAQLAGLGGVDGRVTGSGSAWAHAFALCGPDGIVGHLVVAADAEPSDDQVHVLCMLARQAGCALTTAAVQRRERESASELRKLNARLAEVNERLGASVADLEWRRRVHETLAAAAAAGSGEAGVATAVHQLTGFGVTAEDGFGNLLTWAGPGPPEPCPRPPARHRAAVLDHARRSPRPLRDGDRLVAVAQQRDEVLGVLALLDPDRRAGEHELFALEHGARALTIELAHQRSLVETELRLRRDLVDDLLTGTDDESALSRSQALGHDLHRPHQVLVVHWPGAPSEDALVHAVENATTRVLHARVLLAHRPDGVVLVLPWPDERGDRRPWGQLYRVVAERLRPTAGAIGVGGVCHAPSEIPKSYAEGRRALRVRLGSLTPDGITVDADLGIYRLLTLGDDDRELRQFVRAWLGPLLDYDATNRSDLVMTLLQYLECGGNYDAAARALLIHRSTLRYRLRRIREISGQNLGCVDTRLNLHVAARAWQTLRGEP
ncbi:PucR family transcriptional regulator [Geodermatophilus ruber]|uniref:Transcriptional regulator, CdaR family n=1 Tax=Geodermatophilus ruber TaxID=504800 RepID=A0A1I4AAX5_9ACTN|nr:helix-turn-helix domain-containing protein [Geodermatophilus ruber]SFK53474.1 transcriptional regulator, CdaR family [Geodermatophilus ruber]